MIELNGVTKQYGKFTAVHPIDLTVQRGELFGFLGPNGAGKTTTIRIVTGVLRPTAGTVRIAGKDMVEDPIGAKRHIGYIPDRPALYEKLTGDEFLRFVCGLWGRNGNAMQKRADDLLEMFGLTEWKHSIVENYSHGMRQKLLICSALVHSPDVIVVDEPMIGLDPRAARLMKDVLRAFVDHGGTVFMSTHTLEVAQALCDRIAILNQGRIRAMGTMDELRSEAEAGAAGLEEIFLKLTGGHQVQELVAALRDPE
ncbi:MAG: ABC transporter ATP-binding protein [Gemmatimonadetes bacterium]|nr:ABC transporter ATP-binding protein [Gemmatimonadota bacterium]